MKDKWIMTLRSIQHEEKEDFQTELNTQVDFYEEDGELVIAYDESETTGMEGSRTYLRVQPKMIAVVRTGTFRTHIVVEKGVKHFCHYETPFGEIAVGISAKKLINHLTPEGGSFEMRYTVDGNSTLLSDNEIIVNIRKQEDTTL